MIILGIDPGSENTGYGIIEKNNGTIVHVTSGVVKASARLPFPQRLEKIYTGLTRLMDAYSPDVGAVEGVFFAANVSAAIKLGQARGVALLALAQRGIICEEYSPLEIKQALVGYGRASKDQVALMVSRLLKISTDHPGPDSSDALAVAICHANSERMRSVAHDRIA